MPKLGMFDVAVINPLPMRIRAMHQTYGVTEGQTCKTCAHLVCKHFNKRYYKCDLTRQTNGPGTDWRVSWDACGLWEPREEGEQ